jgi:hypothetical protein
MLSNNSNFKSNKSTDGQKKMKMLERHFIRNNFVPDEVKVRRKAKFPQLKTTSSNTETRQQTTRLPSSSQATSRQPVARQPIARQPVARQPVVHQPTKSIFKNKLTKDVPVLGKASNQHTKDTTRVTGYAAPGRTVVLENENNRMRVKIPVVKQSATGQLAASQLAASQPAASQLAASQLATSQLAASQLTTSQLATSQLAASQQATRTRVTGYAAPGRKVVLENENNQMRVEIPASRSAQSAQSVESAQTTMNQLAKQMDDDSDISSPDEDLDTISSSSDEDLPSDELQEVSDEIEFKVLNSNDIKHNLKIIKDLREGEKLNFTSKGKLLEVESGWVPSVSRMWGGVGRKQIVEFIEHNTKSAFKLIDDITTGKIDNKALSDMDKLAYTERQLLHDIKRELVESTRGLKNMKNTYRGDTNIITKLDTIIDSIKQKNGNVNDELQILRN